MPPFDAADLGLIVPELILGCCILLLFVGDLVVDSERYKRLFLTPLALLGVVGAGIASTTTMHVNTAAFAGQVAIDPMAGIFKVLFLVITGVAIFTSLLSKELADRHMGEYYALLLSITFGMFLMASANDLLMIYLGVELVSIVSYAMAGYRLHDKRSSEAALKYVIYGGAASGVMLFGISLLYGCFGTTELSAIHHALASGGVGDSGVLGAIIPASKIFPITVLVSVLFVFAGIAYKIAVVPFHMWSPDVYEGAPTPFTGFLSVGPKAAGFALLMRFFVDLFVPVGSKGFAAVDGMMEVAIDLPLPHVIGILAAATMTIGNFAAIPQQNVKRLLAYSSIAHAGYVLMAFVVLSEAALDAVVFYLVIYFFMNMGAFTVCQAVRDSTGGELLHDFKGLGSRQPVLAVTMVIFLLSLTGLPPLAGFIAKFYVFAAVIERGGTFYWALAVIAIINSAVSLYYYMRVAKAMWLTPPVTEEPMRLRPGYLGLVMVLALPVLVFGLYWSPITGTIKGTLAFYRSEKPAQVAQVPSTFPFDSPSGLAQDVLRTGTGGMQAEPRR